MQNTCSIMAESVNFRQKHCTFPPERMFNPSGQIVQFCQNAWSIFPDRLFIYPITIAYFEQNNSSNQQESVQIDRNSCTFMPECMFIYSRICVFLSSRGDHLWKSSCTSEPVSMHNLFRDNVQFKSELRVQFCQKICTFLPLGLLNLKKNPCTA